MPGKSFYILFSILDLVQLKKYNFIETDFLINTIASQPLIYLQIFVDLSSSPKFNSLTLICLNFHILYFSRICGPFPNISFLK